MKITIAGREIEATPMTFGGERAMVASILCDDGTVLKITVLIAEILRLEGEKDQLGRQGYWVSQMMAVAPA